MSHCTCTAVVWNMCKKDLRHSDEKHEQMHRNETGLTIMTDDSIEVTVEDGKLLNGFKADLNGSFTTSTDSEISSV